VGQSASGEVPAETLVEAFKRELEALSGHVHLPADDDDGVGQIVDILDRHQAHRLLAWDESSLGLSGLSSGLARAGIAVERIELARHSPERTTQLAQIDEVTVGLTGAHGGLADTGAIALMSGPGRSRLASLLPPVHIALLPKDRLYASISAFLTANPRATEAGSNLVFIAGPSRSGDIELTLSMGVHGPGEVHVLILP
jgi:L-lactate dehydrogenase complex protein LldG